MNYNFRDDIKDGEKGEAIIAEFLKGHKYELLNDNKDNRYDLKMLNHLGNETTFEIKTDVYCSNERDTGNMFVEKESRGKLSGISVSQANWFIMYYPHFKEAWFIRSSELRDLIERSDFYVATGGDKGSNTKGYLIKRELFKNHFKVQTIDFDW
jgi:hypothetical protein